MSRVLKRPMFRKGGPVMEGIMNGIVDRQQMQEGGPARQYRFSETPIAKAGEALTAYGPNAAIAGVYDLAAVPINTLGRLFGYNPGLSGTKFVDTLTGGRFSEFTGYDPDKAKFLGFDTSAKRGFTTPSMQEKPDAPPPPPPPPPKEKPKQTDVALDKKENELLTTYSELLPMLETALAQDEDETIRNRYLQLAKFGASLAAQPGGSLTRAIGRAAVPAIAGLEKEVADRQARETLAKRVALETAIKQTTDLGRVGEAIRDTKKIIPKKQGESEEAYNQRIYNEVVNRDTDTGRRTKESIVDKNEEAIEDLGIPKFKSRRIARQMDENNLTIADVNEKPKDKSKIEPGKYYIDKDQGLFKWDGKKVIKPGQKGF